MELCFFATGKPTKRQTRIMHIKFIVLLVCLLSHISAQCTPSATRFCVSADGDPKYIIDGTARKTLTVQKGITYSFQMNSVPSFHPYYITTSSSGGGLGEYLDGVTNSGAIGLKKLQFWLIIVQIILC